MSELVRSAAFLAARGLSARSSPVKRSHLSEVIAAALGYRTFAALVLEENDTSLNLHLTDAEVVVLNAEMATARCLELMPEMATSVAVATVDTTFGAIEQAANGSFAGFRGVADFYDSYAREELIQAVESSNDVADAMAESNADFSSEPYFPEASPVVSDLWPARNLWSIEAAGVWSGSYDPNGNRMFNGNSFNCFARLTYKKAGRAGLVFDESEAGASSNDAWRDQDRDAEATHWAEQAGSHRPVFSRPQDEMKAACMKHKNRDRMTDSDRELRAQMPDLSLQYGSAVEALEYARDYLKCLLSMERFRVHPLSVARIEMRALLPYAIHPLEGEGRFIVLGREYKPIGMAMKKEHVDYERFPNLHLIVPAVELHRTTTGGKRRPGWLYTDMTPPYKGRVEAQALLERVERVIDLTKTNN